MVKTWLLLPFPVQECRRWVEYAQDRSNQNIYLFEQKLQNEITTLVKCSSNNCSSTRIISHGQNLETYIQTYRWYRYCKLAQHILFPPLKSLTIDTKWNYKKCDCVQASGINREKMSDLCLFWDGCKFSFFVQLCPPW